jgi:hypothetical protein
MVSLSVGKTSRKERTETNKQRTFAKLVEDDCCGESVADATPEFTPTKQRVLQQNRLLTIETSTGRLSTVVGVNSVVRKTDA